MRLSKVLMDGGILPGMKAYPVGNIDLPVTFGNKTNFRTKTLTFEVVDWKGVYHTLLGRPSYATFMAVPNYTYLKLKMPGPNGVITVSGCFEQAYISSRGYYDLATTVANSAKLGQLRATTAECCPNAGKPSQAPAFVSNDETQAIAVDGADPTKTVRIGSQLPPK